MSLLTSLSSRAAVRAAVRGHGRIAAPALTQARRLASKSDDAYENLDLNQRAIFERLIRQNSSIVDSTIKAAEALNMANVEAPSYEEVLKLSEQNVNLKAALAYTEKSVARALRGAQTSFKKEPVRVAITGAAGAIGYSLVFRVASGEMLGPDQPVILQLIEVESVLPKLQGVVMELQDCAFPTLAGIETTANLEKGFEAADYALLVGSKPRTKGMERGDLLMENGKIFVAQGSAINKVASRDVKVVVVGNPANTNCLIAAHNAPDLGPEQFTALTRLDHDRALAQLAEKLNCQSKDLQRVCIWGNHSATQYPDISHATLNNQLVRSLINDDKWVRDVFIPTVQKRGAAIIEARGASSAASAANAALMHMRDWVAGTNSQWTSMAIPSDSAYGVGAGVYYSYPVVCESGTYTKVYDVPIDSFSAEMMEKTRQELFAERDMVKDFLRN